MFFINLPLTIQELEVTAAWLLSIQIDNYLPAHALLDRAVCTAILKLGDHTVAPNAWRVFNRSYAAFQVGRSLRERRPSKKGTL